MVEQKPRVRRRAPKVRTGCVTCKRRRVKCDERKPFCARCESLGLGCEGYVVPKTWIFEPDDSPTTTIAYRKRINPAGPRKLLPKPQSVELDKVGPMWAAHRIASATLPLLLTLSPSDDSEGPQLMQAYARLVFDCPVAWELELRPTNASGFGMRDIEILMLHLTSPVTKQAHLALATTALHFFQPTEFPAHLPIKYIQKAVTMIRRRILEQQYDNSDLLHGIGQLFLATVLQGDENAAQTHVTAAKTLVDQAGGLDAIKPGTAHLLKYSDLHHSVETLQPPTFNYDQGNLSIAFPKNADEDGLPKPEEIELNPDLDLTSAAKQHLPEPLIKAFSTLSRCATLLSRIFVIHPPPVSYFFWMAEETYRNIGSLLQYTPSKTIFHDTRAILVLWLQLFSTLANEQVFDVDIRGNIVTVRGKKVLSMVSAPVRKGLTRWNSIVSAAKRVQKNYTPKPKDDWIVLIEVVNEMEVDQPVKFGPVYDRLFEMRLEKQSAGSSRCEIELL